ncbi:transmembrane protein 161B-like [Sycon ciliatum]|uniref:transmembrane protein 161B-like n=1 Tax=Sycon ciliatum TaxID=27933 RepID=UPI0031F6ED3F
MALLGFHLTASVIATLFLHRVLVYMPVVNWLLSGLLVWTVPGKAYLSEYVQLAEKTSNGTGAKSKSLRKNAAEKRKNQQPSSAAEKDIDLPKDLPLPLLPVKLKSQDSGVLLYYDELFTILNMALVAGLVFLASEVFQSLYPAKWLADVNLTVVWLCLVLVYCLKMLTQLTWLVVKANRLQSGERTLILLTGVCFFLLAILTMVLDGSWLDLKLDRGLAQLVSVVKNDGKVQQKRVSNLFYLLKALVAISAALFASTLAFPALRLARSYLGALKRSSLLGRLLCQAVFVSPLLLLLLWVPPLTTGVLFPDGHDPLIPGLTLAQYEHLRLLLVLHYCAMRLLMSRWHLQMYLDGAHRHVEARRQATTRFTASKFDTAMRTMNSSLAVVALQIVCPVIVLLTCVAILHSAGNFSWTGEYHVAPPAAPINHTESTGNSFRLVSRLPSLIQLLVPMDFFAAVVSFYTVWTLIAISVTTFLGFLYANFVEKDISSSTLVRTGA